MELHALQSGEDRRTRARLARAVLLPLSWLYSAVVAGYRALYDLGVLRVTKLPCRVIAVGNLTVGGTGKSTATRWLARLLSNRGQHVAVLSYGYHGDRDRADTVTVVSDGERIRVPVTESGDEPRMLAEALPGVPVLTGPRRVLSGARAVEAFGAEVCLLDDGFQYWRLQKDLEIVLIDAECPFGHGYLLPRGLLRERPRALARADVLLVMNGERLVTDERDRLHARLSCLAPRALLGAARHVPTGLRGLFNGEIRPLEWLAGRRVAALSSLGNPENFERTLRDLGVAELEPRRYPDHHGYTAAEATGALALDLPLDAVVTTAKDAPKLRHVLGDRPVPGGGQAVFVLDVELEFTEGEAEVMRRLLALVGDGSETVYQTA